MLVGAKLVAQGKQPFHAAPHVIINSTSYYSGRLARYLLHPRVSRSVRWVRNETIRRSFSTHSYDKQGIETQGNPKDLPLYRAYSILNAMTRTPDSPAHSGKLLAAWSQTPTKWYPLPLAVGAILLVAIQYRHKLARSEKEVHVNDEGQEVIKLKGPWQVRPPHPPFLHPPRTRIRL